MRLTDSRRQLGQRGDYSGQRCVGEVYRSNDKGDVGANGYKLLVPEELREKLMIENKKPMIVFKPGVPKIINGKVVASKPDEGTGAKMQFSLL
ncbi:hypothetical protein HPP92_029156 [Vanilla planifolia]|uniref:Uncharacterized protein n=1 Tax=Vanilla planifolia TaxID=51239 RepID=A0A835P4X2_VANPL|nr:hypothetical protein HPP92_029156 [Vanilla planifolia]KAG0445818.1 hypothetical protein HPP92_029145 [Vanilla planifolia]